MDPNAALTAARNAIALAHEAQEEGTPEGDALALERLGDLVEATNAVTALAVASASFTIARTKVFFGFRTWVGKKNAWLGALVLCPYCVSHYLAIAGVVAFWSDIRLVHHFWLFDAVATWLSIVAVAGIVIGQINRAITPVMPPATPAPAPVRAGDPRRG